jgi:hypothetical protein
MLSLFLLILLLQDWTKEEIAEVYKMPMLELLYRAATTHRYAPTVAQLLLLQYCGSLRACNAQCSTVQYAAQQLILS